MDNQELEKLLEGYRQCFESKHHYDMLSWTIAAFVVVFVSVLLPIIPEISVQSEGLTLLFRMIAASIGWSMLWLWDRIYERNRFWGEVSNETARKLEESMDLDGPGHAFMRGHIDKKITLKNRDVGKKDQYNGRPEETVECDADSVHNYIHLVIWVLAIALLGAVFVNIKF